MNQCNPAEGKKASLLLNLESDCAVLPPKKDYSRALHHYTFSFFPYQSFFYLFYTILDRKQNPFEYLEPTWQDKKADLSI